MFIGCESRVGGCGHAEGDQVVMEACILGEDVMIPVERCLREVRIQTIVILLEERCCCERDICYKNDVERRKHTTHLSDCSMP